MDMSVKLNPSYPQVAPQSADAPAIADKDKANVEAVKPLAVEPSRPDLEKAVTDMREFVQANQRQLDFSIDDSTHQVVVKVIATDSGEVIRQIPSETALKMAQNLASGGRLLDEQA